WCKKLDLRSYRRPRLGPSCHFRNCARETAERSAEPWHSPCGRGGRANRRAAKRPTPRLGDGAPNASEPFVDSPAYCARRFVERRGGLPKPASSRDAPGDTSRGCTTPRPHFAPDGQAAARCAGVESSSREGAWTLRRGTRGRSSG